jgi:hypothetical protein
MTVILFEKKSVKYSKEIFEKNNNGNELTQKKVFF